MAGFADLIAASLTTMVTSCGCSRGMFAIV
jgi:hypothetical protein